MPTVVTSATHTTYSATGTEESYAASRAVAMSGATAPPMIVVNWALIDMPVYLTVVGNCSAKNAACGP
jgi:hypothetical protein